MIDNSKEYITASAIYYDDGKVYGNQPRNIKSGIVVTGLRHCNCFPILHAIFPNREYLKNEVSGFITSHNNYVDRFEAAKIALVCGQIKELKYLKDQLDSSDLY